MPLHLLLMPGLFSSASPFCYGSYVFLGRYILIDAYSGISQYLPPLSLIVLHFAPLYFPCSSDKPCAGVRKVVDLFPTSHFSSTLYLVTNELLFGPVNSNAPASRLPLGLSAFVMAPRRTGAKKPTPRSKQTHVPAKKGKQQPEQNARFPKFTHFPAELQWKIFREVMNGDPHFHVLRVGRVDDAETGTWTLSFCPVNKKMDNSGYRMYDILSSVSPAAAAAVGHEMALRRRGEFQQLPFKILKARIDGTKDLIVFDFARSSVPAIGYFHDDHQILNWQNRIFDSDSVAEQFQNTEKLGIKLSDKHYSCHDIAGNFRCADREDEEHASHTSRTNAWRMCPKELAGLLNSFPKLREVHIIIEPYYGNKKHGHMDTYLKNYFTCKCRTSHPLSSLPTPLPTYMY